MVKKKKDTKKKLKVTIIIKAVLFVLLLFLVYIVGLNQGMFRGVFVAGTNHCELIEGTIPIFPYGCEDESQSDTYCINMNCQAFYTGIIPYYDDVYANNGAICLSVNESNINKARIDAALLGAVLSGCPTSLHKIGINKYTENRNWLVNLKGPELNDSMSSDDYSFNISDQTYNITELIMAVNTTAVNPDYSPTLNMSKLLYDGHQVAWVYHIEKVIDEYKYKVVPCIMLTNGTRYCEE